jgi:hypothetical protein
VRCYRDEGWSYRMIGEHLGVSTAKVRAELQRRGIPVHPRQPIGRGSRSSRTEAPVEKLRKLYVESEWSAADVAAQLDSTINVVLRTGHAHGVPIRQGGGGQPQIVVRATMHRLGIALRPEHMSPALLRLRAPAGLPGPGRGRVPRLRFHCRGGHTARLRHQYRAPLARPSRGDRARSRPLDPKEVRAPGERGSVIRAIRVGGRHRRFGRVRRNAEQGSSTKRCGGLPSKPFARQGSTLRSRWHGDGALASSLSRWRRRTGPLGPVVPCDEFVASMNSSIWSRCTGCNPANTASLIGEPALAASRTARARPRAPRVSVSAPRTTSCR